MYIAINISHPDSKGVSSPINIILENGTMVDLNIDRPFEKENGIQKISLAPFYQRFSKLYHTK